MNRVPEEERIPLFRHWRTWYILLIAALAGLILIFYLSMRMFS